MLAKIVTWGRDRGESLERMSDALRQTVVLGVVTNLGRLVAILCHPAFRAGEIHTHFVDEHLDEVAPDGCPPPEALAAALAALHAESAPSDAGATRTTPDPWRDLGAWRLT
jgi:acetyl/propionyl-CoA carboxylase alpha subunit